MITSPETIVAITTVEGGLKFLASARGSYLGGQPHQRWLVGAIKSPKIRWRRGETTNKMLPLSDEYGSTAGCEMATIVVIRWSEEGRKLADGGPKWWQC